MLEKTLAQLVPFEPPGVCKTVLTVTFLLLSADRYFFPPLLYSDLPRQVLGSFGAAP